MSFQTRDTKGIRILKWLSAGVGLIAVLIIIIAIALYLAMRASLPMLDGKQEMAKLAAPVDIARDNNGMVTINAKSSKDAIRALGFVHAQERFFEMDLARRSAAGELSAILGKATLSIDREKRQHRLRMRAAAELSNADVVEREWMTAYTEGVNAGLAALPVRPWQYLVLRTAPEPWRPEDSLLVLAEMYVMLQSGGIEGRFSDIRLRKLLGDRLFDWMRPEGGEWDATLDNIKPPFPVLPSPTDIDTRTTKPAVTKTVQLEKIYAADAEQKPGSNNWAVNRTRTADGRAILADDMHLGLGVPGIWFRAQLDTMHEGKKQRVVGLTLPGIPQIAAGSNGTIAWGFTNSYGQWFDWVAIPKNPTGEKPIAIRTVTETITVKGGEPILLVVRETDFGPVLRQDADNHYALSWVVYRPGALVNRVNVKGMMFATSLDEAINIAQRVPMPHQNILIADNQGNIAWTITGRIPERSSVVRSGSQRGLTTSLANLPTGWLDPAKYPVIKNPVDGLLWTANSKQLGGSGSEIIGDGGFDLGARSTQIRDRLREKPLLNEADLYAIQLDRESRFLKRWAELAMAQATEASANAKIAALATTLKSWNGKADIDQTGHRIARAFRERVQRELWQAWLAAKDGAPKTTDLPEKSDAALSLDSRFEYASWQALEAKAAHLLPPTYTTWTAFLQAQLEFVHDDLIKQHGALANATWGQRNMSRIKHPFSRAMPFLSPYLDMPSQPLAGDNHMPRVAAPGFGASQRLVVSPGREEQGILTVVGGQSGHPLSPFYGAGHKEWQDGVALPLLAGAVKHTVTLQPK